jgi:hypothetical protein
MYRRFWKRQQTQGGKLIMFEHLVVFKFNRILETSEEQSILEQILGLKDQIPGVVELSAGWNETEELGNIHGFTLGLRVLFTDKEALRNYGPHPAHQALVGRIGGMLGQVVVVDFPV